MSLFVLRDGYRVMAAPGGARVVHVATGKALELSPEDLQVFARATAGGVDAREPQLRSIIRKFVQLGILVGARGGTQTFARPPLAPAPPKAPAETPSEPTSSVRYTLKAKESSPPKPLTAPTPKPGPDDPVRLFRRDLNVNRRPSSSLYDVTDPAAGKTFPVYDFEVSLARMLDGRRRYSEVVEAGQRLGIPVNLDSLFQFVRQLEAYGFLAPVGSSLKESKEASKWAPRRQWDEGLRALFQSGLKMHRHGRYQEAVNYFEAMLEQDPENPEALEMLEQARQRASTSAILEKPQAAPPPASDPAQISVEQLIAEDSFFFEPLETEVTQALAEADFERIPSKPRIIAGALTANPVSSGRKKWLWVGLGVLAIAGAAVGGVWFFTPNEPVTFSRVPRRPQAKAAAPDAGTAPALAANTGQKQMTPPAATPNAAGKTGAVPGAPVSAVKSEAPAAPGDAGRKLAEVLGAAAEGATPRVPLAAALPDAGANVQGNTRVLSGTSAPAISSKSPPKWITAKIDRRRRPKIGDVRAPAAGVVRWKAPPQQRVRGGEVVGTVSASGGRRQYLLIAPKDGVLVPRAKEGQKISRSDKVAALQSSQIELQAFVSAARPETPWACELFDGASDRKAPCRVVTVDSRGSKYRVTVTTESGEFETAEKTVLRLSPP